MCSVALLKTNKDTIGTMNYFVTAQLAIESSYSERNFANHDISYKKVLRFNFK